MTSTSSSESSSAERHWRRTKPGDREKARELVIEAIDLYREIGMPKHQEMAEELLAGA